MPLFQYAGISAEGRNVNGTIEAVSEKIAYDLLSGKGVIPTSIQAGEAEEKKPVLSRSFSFGRISLSTRALFVRELATFIHADIPLLEALDVLHRQEANPAFKTILAAVHDRVQSGESFSKALSNHPKVFSPLLVSMVRVGETGGVMGPVLDQMATWMEHEEEVMGEIRGALAYPLMIVCLGIVTLIILMSFVLPRISAIFAGMEGNLPTITKLLMGTSSFMGRWWWLIIMAGIGIAVAIRQALKTEPGRRIYDRLSLSAPILGPLARKSAIARFARANAALLSAGVPLLEALRVVRGLLSNGIMAAMVDQTIAQVTRGQSLAGTMAELPYFPPSVIHLLRVGERTGRLSEMFGRVADTFEKQTRAQIKIMLNLLSPLMIVALAVMVALIAISILLPIFQMNKLMR